MGFKIVLPLFEALSSWWFKVCFGLGLVIVYIQGWLKSQLGFFEVLGFDEGLFGVGSWLLPGLLSRYFRLV